MKPLLTVVLAFAAVFSGCGGNAGSTTAPSQHAPSATQPDPTPPRPSPPSSGLALGLSAVTTSVNQPATFIASCSAAAEATLDFGDGAQTEFAVDSGVNVRLTHAYAHGGTFVATLTARNDVGESASLATTLFVR